MLNNNKFFIYIFILTSVWINTAFAAPPRLLTSSEIPIRVERDITDIIINPDGSSVKIEEQSIKVLNQKAVEYLKQKTISYSTSVERVDVLEAYTQKANGKKIIVPKDNYQFNINKGQSNNNPAFSDRTRLTIIFPDVMVGDTVNIKYRTTETEPMFPGHFSVAEYYQRNIAYDESLVRIDSPSTMTFQYSATDMTTKLDQTKDGRKILELVWKNPNPTESNRRNYTVVDLEKEPGFSYSTFKDYSEIAEAYGSRARPKAEVTERSRQLAEEITKDIKDPREQARLLYEWVATNIDYAGNCVGVGAVVPRDQSFVLDNRMGDCKDMATILQSLLSAKGIISTQALINSGRTYRLPKIPVISVVNHVIVYIPSLNIYLDPTSRTVPFGMLPQGDLDKPVLLVDGYRTDIRTPSSGLDNKITVKSNVTVKPDGVVAGKVDVATRGTYASDGRARWRDVTSQQKEKVLDRLYRQESTIGFGRLDSEDPNPMLNTFTYNVTFEKEKYIQVPGPGGFTVGPFWPTEGTIQSILSVSPDTEAEEIYCEGGSITEEYVITMPKNMKIIAIPKNLSVSNQDISYRSTYSRKNNVITIKREFIDKTKRNVCPASIEHEFAKISGKIINDIKAQIIYQ